MTRFEQFCAKWQHGCGSGLCEQATHLCFARGSIPCEVLLVGEAPGESEDAVGQPFVGPAGRLLTDIVEGAIPDKRTPFEVREGLGFRVGTPWAMVHDKYIEEYNRPYVRCGFTNLTLCIPRDEEGLKSGAPTDHEIRDCMPRLVEFISLCNPKLIVCVGTLARDTFDRKTRGHIQLPKEIPWVSIDHPAFILRQNIAVRGIQVQRAIVTIQNAVEEYCS